MSCPSYGRVVGESGNHCGPWLRALGNAGVAAQQEGRVAPGRGGSEGLPMGSHVLREGRRRPPRGRLAEPGERIGGGKEAPVAGGRAWVLRPLPLQGAILVQPVLAAGNWFRVRGNPVSRRHGRDPDRFSQRQAARTLLEELRWWRFGNPSVFTRSRARGLSEHWSAFPHERLGWNHPSCEMVDGDN